MYIRNWLTSVSPVALFAGENGAGDGAPGAGGDPPAGKTTVFNEDVGAENDGAVAGTAEGAEADGATAAAGGAEGAEGDPPAEADPPAPDWRDREIARKHRKVQEAERRTATLEAELADVRALLERGGKQPADGEPPAVRPAALSPDDPAVQRAAQTIVAKSEYDRQCNEADEKGRKTFGKKWDDAIDRIAMLGGLGDGADGVEVMTGILATDDPSKVLLELGSNPDTFHRVMALPPHRRQTELVKLAITAKPTTKKPSGAPPPVEPLTRRADARDDNFLYRDNVSDEDWYKQRAADKRRKWEEKQGQRA